MALNPLIRVNAIVADGLKNEKLLKLYRDLNSKVLIPRSSKTIKIVGKLIAPFDRRGRASKGTSGDRRKSNVEFDIMLEEYYRARRLNDMGYPEQGLLDDLGLADVAELLYQKAAG